MSELIDGAPVSFSGVPRNGVEFGDVGELLTQVGRGAHVKWASGPNRGQVTLVDVHDLQPAHPHAARGLTPSDGLEDSLELGPPTIQTGLSHLCAVRGPSAVLATLANSAPTDFAAVVAAVRDYAHTCVSQAPVIRQALAQLDDEEASEVLRLATIAVIQDVANA